MDDARVIRTGGPRPSVAVLPVRGRQVLLVAGAVAFVAAGVWMLLVGSLSVRLAGGAAVVFFGLCAGYGAWLAFRPGPAVVVDDTGVTDRASATGAGWVPWSEITGLSVLTISRQQTVTVHVRSPEAVLARASAPARAAMRASMRMSGSPVNIATTALPLTAEQLAAEIAAFAPGATPPAAPGSHP